MKPRLLLLLLACGCGSSLEPIAGDVYVLDRIAGVNLPASWSFDPGTVNRIHSDTLGLAASGRGERRTVYDSFQGTKRDERVGFSYTRVGDRIEIALDCADGAVCVAPPHFVGTITSTGLTLTESKIARVPFEFHRVFPPD